MKKPLTALLITAFVLSSCGAIRDSRVNPFNWFGKARSEATVESTEEVNPLIPTTRRSLFSRQKADYAGTPMQSVTSLVVERTSGGAIVRATGVAARQGEFSAQLTPENEDELPVDGVLTYYLDAVKPPRPQPVGAVRTREITVARKLSDQQLAGVRTIRVVGASNTLTTRR